MNHRLSILLGTIISISLVANCGGGGALTSNDPTTKKKKEKLTTDDDQLASDPAVVTGAYLACEVSPADTADAPAGSRGVGCSVLTAKGKQMRPGANQSLDFVALTPAAIQPASKNTPTGYQAVFHLEKTLLPKTDYSAKLMEGSKLIKDFKGTIKNPLAALQLMEKTHGLWTPSAAPAMVTRFATNENCPAAPDNYCNNDGTLSKNSPATRQSIQACLPSDDLAAIIALFARWTPNGADPVTSVTIGSQTTKCTHHKKVGGQNKFFIEGKVCSVAIVSKQGEDAKTIVYKNSDLPFPPTIMEKRLAAMDCDNPR